MRASLRILVALLIALPFDIALLILYWIELALLFRPGLRPGLDHEDVHAQGVGSG